MRSAEDNTAKEKAKLSFLRNNRNVEIGKRRGKGVGRGLNRKQSGQAFEYISA